MRNSLPLSLLAATLVLGPGVANADDVSGYYVKAFAGLSSLQGDSLSIDGVPSSLSFDGATFAAGAVGYDYADSPLRAEVEFAYRSGDAVNLPGSVAQTGDFASTALMVNGYYMLETASSWTPYIGVGAGYVTEIDFDLEDGAAAGEYSERGGLALQAMVGVEVPVSARAVLFGELRYFSAGSVDLTGPGGAVLSADYDTLDVSAGLAFRF